MLQDVLAIKEVDIPSFVYTLDMQQLEQLCSITGKPMKNNHVRVIVNMFMPYIKEVVALKVG